MSFLAYRIKEFNHKVKFTVFSGNIRSLDRESRSLSDGFRS